MKKLILLTIGLLAVSGLFSQGTPYHYTVAGAASNEIVYCANQDNHGRLLIGTDNGLFRFNGYKRTRISFNGSVARDISFLACAGSNIYAANQAGQLFHLVNDKLEVVYPEKFSGDIRQLSIRQDHLVIVGTKFIWTYDAETMRLLNQYQVPFTDPQKTGATGVDMSGSRPMAVLNSGELVDLNEEASYSLPRAWGKFVVEFAGQHVVIPSFTSGEYLYAFKDYRFRSLGSLSASGNRKVTNALTHNGKLFVLTEDGIFVYSGGLDRRPAHWFENIPVTNMFPDSYGNYWICTRGKGMLFIPAGRHDLIYPASLLSIEAGPMNTFFGGLLDGSIARISSRGDELKRFSNPAGTGEALSLFYDPRDKNLYSSNGIYSILTGRILDITNSGIRNIVREKSGCLFVARTSGLVYFRAGSRYANPWSATDSSSFEVLDRGPVKGLVYNEVSDEIAFSTLNGVFTRKSDGTVTEIKNLGFSIDAQNIVFLNDDLVIATTNGGILISRNGKIARRLDISGSLGDLIILKMIADNNYLYFLTEKGMYRFAAGSPKVESLKELIGFEGLIMRDFTIMNGFIYVATQRGVLRFVWKQEKLSKFSLVVSGIYGRKYRKDIYKNGRFIFPADEETIVIPFECVDLTGNQQFLVQYAITAPGEKRLWNSLPSNSNQLNLSHLGPGTYNVELRLLEPLSRTVTPIRRVSFTLLGHWYNRPVLWWLFGLMTALTVGYFWRRSLISQRRRILHKLRDRRRTRTINSVRRRENS